MSFTGPPTKDLHCSLAQTQDVTSPNLSLSGSPSPHQALPASLTIIPSQTGPSFPSQSPYFPFLSFSGAQSPFQALPPFHNPHFPWPCQYYLSISSLPLPTRSLSALFLSLKPSFLSQALPLAYQALPLSKLSRPIWLSFSCGPFQTLPVHPKTLPFIHTLISLRPISPS